MAANDAKRSAAPNRETPPEQIPQKKKRSESAEAMMATSHHGQAWSMLDKRLPLQEWSIGLHVAEDL